MSSKDSSSNVTSLVTSTRKSNGGSSKIGRPTKLDDTVIVQLAEIVGSGSYLTTACGIVGIDPFTYRTWLERGSIEQEKGLETLYTRFVAAIKRAESDNEHRIAQSVIEASQGGQVIKTTTTRRKDGSSTTEEVTAQPQWLAGMTYLERRHPDRWGRKDRHQVEINESKNITITHVEVVKDYGSGHAEIVEGEIVKKK